MTTRGTRLLLRRVDLMSDILVPRELDRSDASGAAAPVNLDEDSWEDLLTLIEAKKVIPIIGPGVVTYGDESRPLYPWLARRLAERLRIPVAPEPATITLNDVVRTHLSNRGDGNTIYNRLSQILRDECPSPGQSLLDLASISAFNLYVTTTFDPLLPNALDCVRNAGPAAIYEFSTKAEVKDLPAPRDELPGTTVFHLLGRVRPSPGYVVWEGDTLEFLVALQGQMKLMKQLCDDLKEHGLLVLGLHFSDWLVRFFLRISKQESFWTPHLNRAYVADAPDDFSPQSLALFFGALGRDVQVMCHDPVAFCAELAKRWKERHPTSDSRPNNRLPPVPAEMPSKAIFISYAREDEPAAANIVHGLTARGCIVWFDRERLQAGEQWHNALKTAVTTRCCLFLSVVSRTTESTGESYYHRERKWAESRYEGIVHNKEFYIPVVIDDSPLATTHEPPCFHQIQTTRLPGGVVTAEFADRMYRLQQACMAEG